MNKSVTNLSRGFAVCAVMSFAILAGVATAIGQTPKNAAGAASDIKIRQRMTTSRGGQGMESVMYVKGSRMRNEMATTGMSMNTVRQCDLNRTITINDAARTYLITPDGANGGAAVGDGGAPSGVPPADRQPVQTRRGGIVNVTSTITDTGERKEMFGFTARRIKTSMLRESSPDACDPGSSKIETDGWYIDFQFEFYCPMDKKTIETPGVPSRPDCNDEVRTKTVGKGKLGFPLLTTTTIYGADGQVASTVTNEVIELSRSPLDASLFDIPAGYSLAKNYQELYGMPSQAPQNKTARSGNPASPSASTPVSMPSVSAPAGFVSGSTPKKEGASRIGIVMPKAQMTAGDSARAAEALRNTLASYLTAPNVELVAINARLPAQALEEARQSNCDYVLYASLTQKKGGGGMFGKALGSIASSAVGHLPGGSNAGEAVARSVAVTTVYTAADISRDIKSKDELTLEYKLESTDASRPGVASSAKAKAKSDGEDVFTPLVEKAAQAVMDVVVKK